MKRLILVSLTAAILAGCGSTAQQAATGSIHPPRWGKPAPVSTGLLALPPSATATMYDTVTLQTVPANPYALAGYTAGAWPTFRPLRARYPRAHTVSIAISARYHADCLDVEPGDAVPSQAAGWVRADIAAGWRKPCLYSSYWEFVHQIRPDLAAAGINRSQVLEWDADFVGYARLDATFDATQYTDRAFGRNLDASLVLRSFLAIAHPPYAPPAPPKPRRRLVCFGHHATPHTRACQPIVKLYARRTGAAAASAAAVRAARHDLTMHGCAKPYRRAVCVHDGRRVSILAQRARWYTTQAAALRTAYS